MAVSVTDPFSAATARAKFITFQPFDIGKWFVLGFIAWLATLGEGGGSGGGNFGGRGGPGRGGRGTGFSPMNARDDFSEVTSWFSTHLAEVILIGGIVLVVVLAIWLLVTWLSSRAQFMFIEAVAHNTFQVKAPWARYRDQGNSLCVFRIVLSLLAGVMGLAAAAVCLAIAWADIMAGQFGPGAGLAIALAVVLILPMSVFFLVVDWCTISFVTPIMYATGQRVLPAWSEFRSAVMPGHVGPLILCLLMCAALRIGIGILSVVIGCVTCCIGLLPYLSTVATLPLVVFYRCYTIYFLQQFGPRYAIIQEPLPPAAFPVMPPNYGYPPPPPPPVPPAGRDMR